MRTFRSREEWQALILQQQESDLGVLAFCREHDLSTTAFYSRRAQLLGNRTKGTSQFVRANISHSPELSTSTSIQTFEISYAGVNLRLPTSTPATYLAELMRGLGQ